MSDIFDLSRGVKADYNKRSFLQGLSPEERKEYFETNRSIGLEAPEDDGFFGELADRSAGNFIGMMRGLGATFNELGLGSGMQDYFSSVLNQNQQWNAPENQSVAGYIGGALGGALGSTAGVLAASTAGALVNPAVGVSAGLTVGFAQTFGENVQRNRKAGYSEGKAYGMAFLESGIDTAIENMPWGIVGKGTKLASNLARLHKISAAGKKQLLNMVGKKIAAQVGQKEAQNLLFKWGKQALISGLGESGEEGLQYLNTYVNQKLGGDPNAEFSLNEFADVMAQGFIGGFGLGGVQSLPAIRREAQMRKLGNMATPEGDAAAVMEAAETVDAENSIEAQPLFDTLISEVGNALGINIDFMDSRPDGAELEKENNGIYDKNNKTLYLNRNTYSVNPAETLGHELKHYIDDNIPELSSAFNSLLEAGKNDAGKQEVLEIARELGVTEEAGNKEFSADMFGKLFARPDTWQKMSEYLDEKTPGMGEKFLQTLRDFYSLVKQKLEKLVGINPEAETFLSNVNDLQNEAARMLAELRRRNGTSNQVENVVGAKGNTNVETVPVSQINVDAKRFQFKSNTNKTSGVDESNKLGGDWDARTAGNLYLWQDKNGKLYVVNGHHRLELAQRNGVENVNAIIDREADGVTAEQARRNGVLINIRDGQGEVRDYASFVRDENLSEDEAKSAGVTARKKGRAGFLLGKSGNTLYDAYRNEVVPESKAVIIAEVAQGNEAIEYAGIKLATDRKLSGEILRQTLKLAAQNTSGTKADTVQDSLFDMTDDSVLKEWELIGKAAAKHIKEIRTRIEAAKDAIKNPEAAKSLGVKTTKGAEKLLAQAQDELARWEHYATDAELMAQLREEAGIAPKEEVVSAENAQTTEDVVISKTENTAAPEENTMELFEAQSPVVKENLTTEKAENDALQKMRDTFANRSELLKGTYGGVLWTDIAREYADGQVLSKDVSDEVLQEIIGMAKEDYKWSESRNVLYAIAQNANFTPGIRKKAEAAIKVIDKKISDDVVRSIKQVSATISKITSAKAGSRERIMAFTELPDGEHTVSGYTFVKNNAGFTLDGEVLNAREIEKAVRTSAYAKLKDRSAEIGMTFKEFTEGFQRSRDAIFAKARRAFGETLGNDIEDKWETAANEAMAKAYMGYSADSKAGINTYASQVLVNAIKEVNRAHKAEFIRTEGKVSLDQTNEQGETLAGAVADENASSISEEKSKDLVGDYRKWKSTLNPRDQKILDLSESGKSPSVIARAEGIGMTTEKVKVRLRELAAAARTEGELQFMRKRGRAIENREIVINTNTSQYPMPSPFNPKELKAWLKSFYKQKKKPINANTGWTISVPGTGIEETLNHLYRNRKNYRSDLHYLSLPYIDKMLENAEFEKFDEVEQGKNADAISIFNVIVDFGDQGKYNARMVIKHFGEAKNFYDHKLTKFEELSDLELQPEGSGSLNNSSTSVNIPQSGEKSSDNLEFMRKKMHKQINPGVVDGKVRDEYADLLAKYKYNVTTLKELQDKALDWIVERGGIVQATEDILNDKAPANSAVAEIARRYILNSEVFANDVSYEDRVKLNKLEMEDRSSWGLTGRAMRLDALNMKDAASVQALLNKLHEDMPPEDVRKLRKEIKDELDIDIFKLPKDVVEDKNRLDAVLRKHLTHKASWQNKVYEYWINSILSGPSTHVANFLGNTANALYELGIKRFTEALVNTVAGRKDGATFGEFKAMLNAFNWQNAKEAAKQSYNLEVLDPSGKFMENRSVAIGGKAGRFIRIPGRVLKAADALAKAIVEPMETAAYAFRMGAQEGLSGDKLQAYIQAQLSDKNSTAYNWGKQRGQELAFQENPGEFINRLMALRETPGVIGTALKIFLPFIKTPTNILRQGARKSILGSGFLLVNTISRIKNKQGFDGAYIARAAEQLLAWGAFAALYGLSGDDDDLPFITGSSAPYGSAEFGFKANKIPPYSIRLGNTYYSYKRIEPLASGLALMADSIQAWRNAKNGKDGMVVMKDLFRSGKQIIVEKSFFDSLGELNKMKEDPEHFVKALANPAKGFIPNIYTQVRQAFDENVQDTKSREKGMEWFKDQFFIVTNQAGVTTALPKIDYFGREVKKDDWGDTLLSPLGRLLPIKRIETDSNVDAAERLIYNYNQHNPNDTWYPSIPQPNFTRNKRKYYFSGENYTKFSIDAGVLAHRQIKNAIAAKRLNVSNPQKEDIELIKKIFTRARREMVDKHFRKAKAY